MKNIGRVAVGLAVVALLCFCGFGAYLLSLIEWSNPGNENTVVRPDDGGKQIPHVADQRLEAFRADWSIYDRFEYWPALLPLAEMSNIAYSKEPDALEEFRRLGFTSGRIIDSAFHTQVAYVATGGDVAVVVFRGTDDTEDWFTNANFYLHKLPVGEIHTGFAGAYGMVQAQVLRELEKAKPKHIWITGHSLGGAMALACAVDLEILQNRPVKGVITFGQPMIGKAELTSKIQSYLKDQYAHFVNERDAVPFLPVQFSHCGCLIRFFNGKVLISEDYLRFSAKSAGPNEELPELEPMKELPPIDPELYEQFNRTYDGEKVVYVPVNPEATYSEADSKSTINSSSPALPNDPFAQPAVGEPSVSGFVPWKEDHSMKLYAEKIRTAIDRVRGR